jgi:hypothetical protein
MTPPRRRLWLIAFSEGIGRQWWKPLLRPGYRHVCAASYFADMERWLYIDPTYRGLEIEMWKPEEFGARLEQMARDSTLILRVPSATDRTMPPLSWFCVGAVKALLGLPTVAVTPWQLSRQLLRMGAETVATNEGSVFMPPTSSQTSPYPVEYSLSREAVADSNRVLHQISVSEPDSNRPAQYE